MISHSLIFQLSAQVDGIPQFPSILQEANVGVYTIEECEDLHGAGDIENNEHVCVGLQGETGACNVSILII